MIILESDGAKAELGAFAHQLALSQKTLVVNEPQFRHIESFIQDGPIRKIDEESRLGETIYVRFDSIARVHDQIAERLRRVQPKQRVLLDFDDHEGFGQRISKKNRALLLADLVGLLGPITNLELVSVLEEVLGAGSYDFLRLDRSLLRSLRILAEDLQLGGQSYMVTRLGTGPFCDYDLGDLLEMRGAVLLSYRKHDRARFDLLRGRAEATR